MDEQEQEEAKRRIDAQIGRVDPLKRILEAEPRPLATLYSEEGITTILKYDENA
jgi:hypothetical protein